MLVSYLPWTERILRGFLSCINECLYSLLVKLLDSFQIKLELNLTLLNSHDISEILLDCSRNLVSSVCKQILLVLLEITLRIYLVPVTYSTFCATWCFGHVISVLCCSSIDCLQRFLFIPKYCMSCIDFRCVVKNMSYSENLWQVQ